jgi:hypothetical protein
MDKYTQFNTDGSVNVSASTQTYTSALNTWVLENEVPSDNIANAVDEVLAQSANGRAPIPALCHMVSTRLGADVNTLKMISSRVQTFIRAQINDGKLFVVRGFGGGVTKTEPVKKA